jgi:hypothetical protein
MARRDAPDLIRAVFFGGDASGRPARLAAGEDGMISLAAVLAVLFFLVLVALVGNVGVVVNHKIEAQNAADAVTISSARQMARGLNAVTAANHLLGELLSLVALHEAIGGKFNDDGDEGYPDDLTARLRDARARIDGYEQTLDERKRDHEILRKTTSYNARYIAWDEVRDADKKHAAADNMLLDSRADLKRVLGDVYLVKNVGLGLYSLGEKITWPPLAAFLEGVGALMYEAASLVEVYIRVEWEALGVFEEIARDTKGLRDEVFSLLPNIRQFELDVRERVPELVSQTARAVGERNGGLGASFPQTRPLVVVDDPSRPGYGDSFRRSQVVRATFPWVNYDRQPILRLTRWMVFSHARDHYKEWSNLMTLQKGRELYDRGVYLLMLLDSAPDQKGHEIWTHQPEAADQMFSLMGFAHRPPPKLWSPGFYPAVNRDGYTTFAQALVYNANAQAEDPQPGEFQPEVGWDTLNWASPAADSNALEYGHDRDDTGCPKIRLNWQAKLVPVTRLREAIESPPDPSLAPALQRLDPDSPLAQTH